MVFQDVNHQLFSESVSEDVTLGLRLSEDEKRSHCRRNAVAHGALGLSGGTSHGAVGRTEAEAGHRRRTGGTKGYYLLRRTHQRSPTTATWSAWREYRRLSKMGKTQFVITHDPELVEKCCDRFLFFENGKITDSGSWTAEALEQVRTYFVTLI